MTLDIGGNRLRRVSDFRIASPMRVDRLGRNYAEVPDTIREFMPRGVVIRTVINNMTFDGATKDPMQQAARDALIAFMAATAQAPQVEAAKEAQRAGIAHAKALADGRYKGRKPSYSRQQYDAVRDMLTQDTGIHAAANLDADAAHFDLDAGRLFNAGFLGRPSSSTRGIHVQTADDEAYQKSCRLFSAWPCALY